MQPPSRLRFKHKRDDTDVDVDAEHPPKRPRTGATVLAVAKPPEPRRTAGAAIRSMSNAIPDPVSQFYSGFDQLLSLRDAATDWKLQLLGKLALEASNVREREISAQLSSAQIEGTSSPL